MKKKDFVFLAVLLGLLFAWPNIDRWLHRSFFKNNAPAAPITDGIAVETPAPEPSTPASSPGEVAALPPSVIAPSAATQQEPDAPIHTWTLKNAVMSLDWSSRGGAITRVVLNEYRSHLDPNSDPVALDFTDGPALAYGGFDGLGTNRSFEGTVDAAGRTLKLQRKTIGGLSLTRTVRLNERFELRVEDVVRNDGGATVLIPSVALMTGPMRREVGHKDMTGFVSLGIDSLSPGGHDVVHWGGKLSKQFEEEREQKSLPKIPLHIDRAPEMKTEAVDWVAAKNKYFVQIITPDEGGDGLRFHLTREPAPGEREQPDLPVKMTSVDSVAASVVFNELEIPAGGEWRKAYAVYIGPKKLSELGPLSLHRDEVMEIGAWLKPISKVLLRTMNGIHAVIPNYGIAIMLLTVIIRMVFWPVTHKSTQSMKRMAELQPLIKQVQEKYQKDPQRMQREMMQIYKDHKVNPVAGCLPMLIQIPFFFALFLVLRSAIELRFASFLWISDLSEPENLFVNLIGFPINLLPLLMAATMYWQQKITPTAGDPQQARLMRIMMTGMMLFFLYGYAAGLALYWTTQNLLMIGQQLWMQRKKPATAKA